MQPIRLSYPLAVDDPNGRPQIVAIGDFDGVHLGHQEVISRAVQKGTELQLPAAVMTFDPHPRLLLGMEKYNHLLTPVAVKQELFKQLGVDRNFIVDFNEKLMRATPEQFVEHVLIPLQVHTVFVGFDFTFGFKGEGTPDTLRQLSKGRFAVEEIKPFLLNGEKVSSTFIRELIHNGDVKTASTLLGRPYSIKGTVVHGEARGRTIGFPTANIQVNEPYVIPMNGVYAVQAIVQGHQVDGVMNIGTKPTFNTNVPEPVLEAHLFDFSGSIYEEYVQVELLDFIRKEQKFASVQELIDQIQQDAQQAKLVIAHRKSVNTL